MKSTMQCRDAKAAHEVMYRRYQNHYGSLENRRGLIEFFSPARSFGNGRDNLVAVFDPSRKVITFKDAPSGNSRPEDRVPPWARY